MDEPESIAALLNAYGQGLSDLLSFGGDDGWIGFGLSETELQAARAAQAALVPIKQEDQNASTSQGQNAKPKRARSGNSDRDVKQNQGSASLAVKNPKALQAEFEAKLSQLSNLKIANAMLEERCKLLEHVVEAREAQIQRLQEIHEGMSTHNPFQAIGLTVQGMMAIKPAELLQLTKRVMSDIGSKLMQAGLSGEAARDVDGESSELSRLGRELMRAGKYMYLMRPDVLLLASRNVNESRGSAEDMGPFHDAESHWAQAVSHLGLSAQQALKAWLLLDLYSIWHARLMGERVALSRALSEVLGFNRYGSTFRTQGAHDLPGVTEQQLLDQLHTNVVKERCLVMLVSEVFADRVLTGAQLSKLIVHSYPRVPDDIAILSAAAVLHAPPNHHAVPGADPAPATMRTASGSSDAASVGAGTVPPKQQLSQASLQGRLSGPGQGLGAGTGPGPLLMPAVGGMLNPAAGMGYGMGLAQGAGVASFMGGHPAASGIQGSLGRSISGGGGLGMTHSGSSGVGEPGSGQGRLTMASAAASLHQAGLITELESKLLSATSVSGSMM